MADDELLQQASEPIDTTNKFLVAMRGDDLVMILPPARYQSISHKEALVLAAYLVSMVGDDELWARTLTAVQNT